MMVESIRGEPKLVGDKILPAIIGLDVGGTSLKAAKVVGRRRIAAQMEVPAGGGIPRDELLQRIKDCISNLSRKDAPQAVGICFGGLLQADGTMRAGSTNLANLDQVPLKNFFTNHLGLPCRVENDAIAAMRGEAALGAARGYSNAMTLTFGSGIGSGLLLAGQIHRGSHGRAGEIGVWRLVPRQADGNWPTLEDLAAPARFFRLHGRELADLLKLTPQSDEAHGQTSFVFEAIGRAIANAHLLLDLELVVLTGGITSLGDRFRLPIVAAYEAACPIVYRRGLKIVIGKLGPFAGAVGAATLWSEDEDP
jgi:glucokinase